jgi:hypothetical protein
MASTDARLAGIASSIRVIPDVPKPGGFTLDFRTSVPHLAPLSLSTTHLLYHSRGRMSGRETSISVYSKSWLADRSIVFKSIALLCKSSDNVMYKYALRSTHDNSYETFALTAC